MAQVKIKEVLDHLDSKTAKALDRTFRRLMPNSQVDARQFGREFRREMGRVCRAWKYVPDLYVEND